MKIKYAPYQPHCFAFGGFEIQMLSTLDAVKSGGGDASQLDFWSSDNNFDILHCWGLGLANYENVYWAQKARKKIVLTALSPYFDTLYSKAKFLASSIIYRVRLYKEILEKIDALVVVNDLQAQIFHRYYNFPKKKIYIIPNVVKDEFFLKNSFLFEDKYQLNNYVLVAGNVCPRKNQLNLAKACIKKGMSLMIIGSVLDGEEKYGKELESLILTSPSIKWIKGLQSGSDELVSAYHSCKIFALPSHEEQQPISLLEAAACQKPLLIANKLYAKQSYFQNSLLINPNSVDSIANGLTEIFKTPKSYIPPFEIIKNCRNEIVGNLYIEVYKKVMRQI